MLPSAMRRYTLAVALAAASCARTNRELPPPPGYAPSPPQISAETDESRARDLIAKLSRNEFVGATAGFDDRLRAALPADRWQ